MSTDCDVPLRRSAHLRVVRRQSDAALYHAVYGGLLLVDGRVLDLVRMFERPRSPADVLRATDLEPSWADALIRLLEARGFIVSSGADEDAIVAERRAERARDLTAGRQIRAVQLVVTNHCNFRCEYCFEGFGRGPIAQRPTAPAPARPPITTMRPGDAEAFLQSVMAVARRAGNSTLAVQFFGGEPLLNWPAVRHVLQHFGDEHGGIALSYSIVTNGSMVTDEVAATLRTYAVPVMVSYDSPRATVRGRTAGAPDVVTRGIDRLTRRGNRVALNAALTSTTFDLFGCDLVDFAVDHGVREIGVVLDLDPDFYRTHGGRAIADRLWDVRCDGRRKGVTVTGYWHQIFQALVAENRYAAIGYQNCSAMGAQFSIEPSGDVFACKASGARFGRVLDMERLLSSPVYRAYAMRACTSPPACEGCDLCHFCSGLCLGSIENTYGTIHAVEPSACEVYRELSMRFIHDATKRDVPAVSGITSMNWSFAASAPGVARLP